MSGAGDFRDRFAFACRAMNGHGQAVGDFEVRLSRLAKVTWLTGGEKVAEQRLQGVQPIVLTIYDSQAVRDIGAEWRATDLRTGQHYKVTAPPMQSKEFGRGWLDILAQTDTTPAGAA